MKIKLLSALPLAGLLITAMASPNWAGAADPPKTSAPKIYDEAADGSKQIADAVAQAKNEDKRVLLQFGANWCGWCHKLHKLFQSDKTVSEKLRTDYVVVLVDVNKGHNESLVTKYEAQHFGLPFIVILDGDGRHLITKKSDDLEEGDHHSPQKVMEFLKEWAPKR
jgi:thiol:disulfide interchange protein